MPSSKKKNRQPKRKVGRPLKYSTQVCEKICSLIAVSNKGLHTIINKNKDLPSYSTIMSWLSDDTKKEFLDMYTRARGDQADLLADEMLEIADYNGKDNANKINRHKLMIDTRKFIAAKLKPRKYGDKIELSGDADNPIVTKTITGMIVK